MACGLIVVAYITLPLAELMVSPSVSDLQLSLKDAEIRRAIWLSITTAMAAALISFVFGTPLAYILARRRFPGKRLIEGIIDIPIVIPHPVVGIAILGIVGRNHWLGQMLEALGIRIMGSVAGIIAVLTFVGMPFYIHSAKNGFEAISPRLENVSRSLGAPMIATFFRITFPLAWRSMVVGIIMCCARAISEFGAVVVIAYHPMTAPVLIYERFEGYGLKYSQPIAVWLVAVCLCLFVILRMIALRKTRES
jgi:molybdate/tungstate transport system permease protein